MKLTSDHIDQLFAFTRKHYVEWYDLQSELVDHLANGIEQQWQEQPKLSFEEALQREFKKFGVFGFMEVVEERQKSLGKKYTKLIWKHMKAFFKLPRILIILIAAIGLFYVLNSTNLSTEYFMGAIIILGIAYFTFLTVSSYRTRKAAEKSNAKKWLLKDIITQHGTGLGIGMLPIYFCNIILPNSGSFSTINDYFLGFLCVAFVLMCVMIYVMVIEIPKKAEEYLEETYPEYKLTR